VTPLTFGCGDMFPTMLTMSFLLQTFFPEEELNTIGQPGSRLAHISPNATINNPFSSIPRTFWFTIVTLLTVGYGDMFPTTIAGQIITMCSMVLAMLVIALPVSVVGTNFTQACPC
jgi:voltage-gated potassium channel Kch